jgi:hypothetical protein
MASGEGISAFGTTIVFPAIARNRINIINAAANLAFVFIFHDAILQCKIEPM